MRILIAPDKFKGSLTASQAAAAIHAGFLRVLPEAHYEISPIADGGEGTKTIFQDTLGGQQIDVKSHDALGRPIHASYVLFPGKNMALIEMSEASGLWRLQPSELNPLQASTYGTGELMADAMARGVETICVALGGSATNDGGAGMAEALGWKFLDATDNEMSPHPVNFPMIRRIVPPPARPAPCRITALCDVTNPLLGPEGATQVFGPQKGATPAMVETLENSLTHLADLCRSQLNRDFRDVPGAGATGGLAFGLMTFCDAALQKGFDAVSDLLDLGGKIAGADLVITGEGKLDAQSLHGKGPAEVARLAKEHGKPVIAFAGMVEGAIPGIDAALSLANGPLTLDECRSRAAELLADAAERAARLLKISL